VSAVPDPTPDLVTAAWRELTTTRSAELLAAGVGTDTDWGIWVFAWRIEEIGAITGTNRCAVLLSSVRSWGSPNRHNTARFPQLQVEIYADLTRDAVNAPDQRIPQRRAEDVWKVIDPVFHRPGRRGQQLGSGDGTLFVVSTLRGSEPRIEDIPESDGSVRLTVDYNVEMA
jgi:hypothetical protein